MPSPTVDGVPDPADDQEFTFGEFLARQRIALKLTQRQVVDQMRAAGHDYTTQALSNWETKRPPSDPAVVHALEVILDCDGELTERLGLAPSPQASRRLAALEAQIAELRELVEGLLPLARDDR